MKRLLKKDYQRIGQMGKGSDGTPNHSALGPRGIKNSPCDEKMGVEGEELIRLVAVP